MIPAGLILTPDPWDDDPDPIPEPGCDTCGGPGPVEQTSETLTGEPWRECSTCIARAIVHRAVANAPVCDCDEPVLVDYGAHGVVCERCAEREEAAVFGEAG